MGNASGKEEYHPSDDSCYSRIVWGCTIVLSLAILAVMVAGVISLLFGGG
jgi:hypothetical protein